MALIPLKQTITVIPASEGVDEWDNPVQGTPYTLPCRFQEETKLFRGVVGNSIKEQNSVATIIFDKRPNITLKDVFEYTDEFGVVRRYEPIEIEVKRGLNGKALLTVVYVK
jgi:hypothetical protein